MRRLLVSATALAVLAVAVMVYVCVGWWRMESDCGMDEHLVPYGSEVSYAWSWADPGFRCTYRDGHVRTSLMF